MKLPGGLTRSTVVVTKSTVPVGTGDEVERILRQLRPDLDIAVVSNPEFLREGAAILTTSSTPTELSLERKMSTRKKLWPRFTDRFTSTKLPGHLLDTETDQRRANEIAVMKISFINEMADLCERVGADVQEVARGIGLDNRIGSKFLHAGPGFSAVLAFQRTCER